MKRFADRADHAVWVREHIVVSETQNAVTPRLEPAGARRVMRYVERVLPAIDLNDQMRLGAEEIDDVRADGLLAAKAEAVELLAPQARSETHLRLGGILSQFSGEGRSHGAIVTLRRPERHPHPTLAAAEHATGMFGPSVQWTLGRRQALKGEEKLCAFHSAKAGTQRGR